MNNSDGDSSEEKPVVVFAKMTSAAIRNHNLNTRCQASDSDDNLSAVNGHTDMAFIDNTSVDTVSIDTNCLQDNLSVDNSSMNVSMDLHVDSESTLDLKEITQSILDLEETQTCRSNSEYGTSTELHAMTQAPSSPPPSYEHVLAETKLEQAALTTEEVPEEEEGAVGGSEASGSSIETKATNPPEPRKGIEIIHTSHKEFYRAVAKQWGITCKMSDHCRCLDCQSMYFDCEYDYNEQEKTDGGLGAGTPMFISEVMHGTACTLL